MTSLRIRAFILVATLLSGLGLVVIALPGSATGGSGLSVADCVTGTAESVSGCTISGSASDLFERPNGVVVAPDGKTVYASTDAGLAWFDVGSTGAPTYAGCIDCDVNSDSANRPRLGQDPGFAIAPDGSALYVSTDSDGGAIERFTLGADGTPTYASCLIAGGFNGHCVSAPTGLGLESLDLLVSADSSEVYVGDEFTHLHVAGDGTMSLAGCLSDGPLTGCTEAPSSLEGAVGVQRLAFAPDGSVWGSGNGYVTHFGVTAAVPSVTSCASVNTSESGLTGCASLAPADVGSFDLGRLLVSSDGDHLLDSDDDELVKLDIGGAAPSFDSCYGSTNAPAACVSLAQPLLSEFDNDALVASADGSTLYAGTSDGVDVMSLDSAFTPSEIGCIGNKGAPNPCDAETPADSIDSALTLALSPTLPVLYAQTSNGSYATLTELATAGSGMSTGSSPIPSPSATPTSTQSPTPTPTSSTPAPSVTMSGSPTTGTGTVVLASPPSATPSSPAKKPLPPRLTGIAPAPETLLIGFTQANGEGLRITGDTVTCSAAHHRTGVAHGKASPIKVTGLVNAVNYACVVTANTSAGTTLVSNKVVAHPGKLPNVALALPASARTGSVITIRATLTAAGDVVPFRLATLSVQYGIHARFTVIASGFTNRNGVVTYRVRIRRNSTYQVRALFGPAVAYNHGLTVRAV